MRVSVIQGSAGTGKTTTVLNRILQTKEKHNCAWSDICFVSYTRKASREGAIRIKKLVPDLTFEDLRFFGTIHSLAYKALRESSDKEIKILSELEQEALLSKYTKSRLTYKELLKVNGEEQLENLVAKCLDKLNEENKDVSAQVFSTLLKEVVKKHLHISAKYVFIDEAQDLTKDLWACCSMLFANAEEVTFAGDADQSIYRYGGATPDMLLSIAKKAETTVLPVNYRCSDNVWHLAGEIQRNLSFPMPLPQTVKGNEGFYLIESISSQSSILGRIASVAKEKGKTFVLSRSNFFLHSSIRFATNRGILGSWQEIDITDKENHLFLPSCSFNSFRCDIVCTLLTLLGNDKANEIETARAMDYFAQLFEKEDNGKQLLSFCLYLTHLFGRNNTMNFAEKMLRYRKDLFSFVYALCRGNTYETIMYISYYINFFSKGTVLNPVTFSTVHKAKGLECDYVVYLEQSLSTLKDMSRCIDEEISICYVAVTRAKKGAFVCNLNATSFFDTLQIKEKEKGKIPEFVDVPNIPFAVQEFCENRKEYIDYAENLLKEMEAHGRVEKREKAKKEKEREEAERQKQIEERINEDLLF